MVQPSPASTCCPSSTSVTTPSLPYNRIELADLETDAALLALCHVYSVRFPLLTAYRLSRARYYASHASVAGLRVYLVADERFAPVSYTHLRAHETRHDL